MNKNNWLNEYKSNITSQSGEDGIIAKIMEVLDVKTGWCVDVGAFGMSKSNTYSLVANGWNGVMIDFDGGIRRLKRTYRNFDNVQIVRKEVDITTNSLDSILDTTKIPQLFELLSIDIDGNDYYVWESLSRIRQGFQPTYRPMVVVVEYNPIIELDEYVQPFDGQGGASLMSLFKLGKTMNYELVATTDLNAFFVRGDLFSKFNINNNSPESLFTRSGARYGRDTKNYAKT